MVALYTNKKNLKLLLFKTVLIVCVNALYAQPDLPQRTLTVTAMQAIHFGTLCVTGGAGGTVIVGYDGSRA